MVNNLPRPVYEQLKRLWREAAREATVGLLGSDRRRQYVGVFLLKRTAAAMDPFAVLEGFKPCLDGLVLGGILQGDDERYVVGGFGLARKSSDGWIGVRVSLNP